MNTRTAPMIPPQAAICGGQNTATTVGLMSQMQSNAMSQAGKLSVSPMQGNQMGNQMMNPNTMASMNMNNSGMIGSNPMMGNANQMQQQQMNAGNMMSTGMNVNNPMGGNNPMNPGNMMNVNNQMGGAMNNMNPVNPMTSNAGNQMQQAQQMNAGNMMTNTGSMNVNSQMAGGMQMQGNNPMGGNVSTPNMSAMNTGPMSANPMGSNQSLASPASAVSSPIPHMGNMNNLGSPLAPGMAMKPGAQTPPANVLQVVKEVQEEAARQGCGSFGKNLPVAGSMPPPAAMQRGMNVNMGMQQPNAMGMPQQPQQQPPQQQVFITLVIQCNDSCRCCQTSPE